MLDIKKLPKEYLEAMKELLEDEYESYILSLDTSALHGMRINTLKAQPEEIFSLLGKEFERIPWVETGFYLKEDDRLSRSPYYYAGLYYMQEPSAMSPAAFSMVEPGDKVLDLCAAPGGKSTQLACMLGGEGVLVSNDLSSSRAKALLKNIEISGIGNVLITCEEPKKLSHTFEGFFDKILVDAPCSGEGMFRKDLAVLKAYLSRGPEFFHPIQVSILDEAAKMLKPGGYMIYSTCTYSKLEDEDTLLKFLETHPEFEMDYIEANYGFKSSKIIPEAVRLLPHRLRGEGHFLARLHKKADCDAFAASYVYNEKSYIKPAKLPLKVKEFLSNIKREWDEKRFYINREYIYYLPQYYRLDSKIHYIRTGLLLGRIKNNRFEPSQALAMNLKMEEWKNPINLDINDERVMKYLKGETIQADDIDKGYRLLCLNSHPLGFIKQDRDKCKNKYYPGWRWV